MIEVGLEVKGSNFIASAIHLPTNTLKKCSANNENKAIGKCISDVNTEIANLEWICTEDNGDKIKAIHFNGIFDISAKNLKATALESAIEKSLKGEMEIHRFEYNERVHSSYVFAKDKDIAALIQGILDIDGAVYENC